MSPVAFADRLWFIKSIVSSETGGGVGLQTLNLRRGAYTFNLSTILDEKAFHCSSQEELLRTMELQSIWLRSSRKAGTLKARQLRPVRYRDAAFARGMVVNSDTRLW